MAQNFPSISFQGQRVTTASHAQWGTTVLPGRAAPGPAHREPLGAAGRRGQWKSACPALQAPSAPSRARQAASPAGALPSLHRVSLTCPPAPAGSSSLSADVGSKYTSSPVPAALRVNGVRLMEAT